MRKDYLSDRKPETAPEPKTVEGLRAEARSNSKHAVLSGAMATAYAGATVILASAGPDTRAWAGGAASGATVSVGLAIRGALRFVDFSDRATAMEIIQSQQPNTEIPQPHPTTPSAPNIVE